MAKKFINEPKWIAWWDKKNIFSCNLDTKNSKRYFCLDMFPYPSGKGLHVGHPRGYCFSDAISRYMKHKGYEVFHPIGWDAFGLPAEQYAKKTNNNPQIFTTKNINNFRKQLKELGFYYDYNREINTSDPNYFQYTQWFFLLFYKHNLAKYKNILVNYCEKLGTVLSNEEVVVQNDQLVSKRGMYPVIKKYQMQWILEITKYANKLLSGLNSLDWPEGIIRHQQNWIGEVKGKTINLQVKHPNYPNKLTIEAFISENIILTKKIPNILFISYHHLIFRIFPHDEDSSYDYSQNLNQSQRRHGNYEFGFLTPIIVFYNNKKLQINLYVNSAIEAQKFCYFYNSQDINHKLFFTKYNLSLQYLDCKITPKIIFDLGKEISTYKLCDWIFSRQRYWGEPIPIFFDEKNHHYPLSKFDLPVKLPHFKKIFFTKNAITPLSNDKNFVNIIHNGIHGKRECNVMPQWAGSSWYYIGYLLQSGDGKYLKLSSKKVQTRIKKWLPVNLYIGGQEHAVLHLLYARFWHLFLYDQKIVSVKEPFSKLINQGLVLDKNGQKMSKSIGNTINPSAIVKKYSADALRLYMYFAGPISQKITFQEDHIKAMHAWLYRVYTIFSNNWVIHQKPADSETIHVNKFLINITNYFAVHKLNKCISEMMIFINFVYKNQKISYHNFKKFIIVLSCFAPFISEELWHLIGFKKSVIFADWPSHSKNNLNNKDLIEYIVMVNDKKRFIYQGKKQLSQDELYNQIKVIPNVTKYVNGNLVKKVFFIPNKLINLVTCKRGK